MVSAHNLGQIGGKRDRATEACFLHAAGSDGEADSQDGLKCERLLELMVVIVPRPLKGDTKEVVALLHQLLHAVVVGR